ncbi:uncharacterized protein LOC131671566 [Phymastichus coffea]|uniref:uncharacterized protein LOC131671566 n=1 Tax=Phymastichus coffea TaxID=108790 RepID=UPI00273B5894|nr:uncharacterized protein LOC131671566 [Phymastichus coffea]XP_058804054.1 uncharacterized protein LOC131671566 [Phymastichus coffea]
MASPMTEDIPLNFDTQGTSPNTITTIDNGNLTLEEQVHVITIPVINSLPLHHNINVLPEPPLRFINRSAPPSYEEAINSNALPPSYESLFGRMRQAHKSSKGLFDFLPNVLVLLLGTIGCTILLVVSFVLPIIMIIIGGLYLHDCPQGEDIPVYLLVGGIFGVIKESLKFTKAVRYCGDEERVRQSTTLILINCFLLGWLILGSIWVYKEYEPNYDPRLGKYCNKTLYLFAFWLTTGYIVIAVMLIGLYSFSLACILFTK